ncbi:MAG: sodium:proton antiporter [Muribaculaceae bacterium]|nr:sodium:proton antiporter [Muribaculaceae bacterium]
MKHLHLHNRPLREPSLLLSILPVASLLTFLGLVIVFAGASAISSYSHIALLVSAIFAVVLAIFGGSISRRGAIIGFRRSARQILPAVPMLLCIAMVSTTWMLSGVVPTLIDYGLSFLNPRFFLVLTCAVCGVISVLTGSSWSTIATIGVAFMGIGTVMGFSPAMVAGAIISGAYFGDKISPLSDTTVVASSTCGVDLFEHIRYLVLTTLPAMTVAMLVFFGLGLSIGPASVEQESAIQSLLEQEFNITPLTLVIPAITGTLIALRVPTLITLFVSSMLGLGGIFVFQPAIVDRLLSDAGNYIHMTTGLLWSGTTFATGHSAFDDLVSTSGITGMLPTVALVLCAMLFGTAMIGTGMLGRITHAITSRIQKRFALISSTVASGLFLNSCTADQYLSIIVGGNMFRNAYRRQGLEPRLLSRTLEDSVSVTSVLIPWNSCGVTQSAVLGVATAAYLPYCVFNYLSPAFTLLFAYTGFKIKQRFTSPAIAE